MARTIRVFWRQQKSGWFNFNWNGVINEQSVIHISACEAFFLTTTFSGPTVYHASAVLRPSL